MTARIRTVAAGCAATALLTMVPVGAQAQRQAVPRAATHQVAVAGGTYYRPYYPRYVYPYAYPYYYPYAYGYPFGFSIGFGFGWYGPYYYPGAYPGFPPYGGYYGPGYYGGGYASVRLQVAPRDAEVFVDGYFAGTVDDFDGSFQRLHLDPGDHELELYHPGRQSVRQQVYLQPDKTFTVKLDMPALAPGDPLPARPAPKPAPNPQATPNATPNDRDPQNRRPPEQTRPPSNGPRPEAGRTASEFGSIALRVQPRDAEVLIDGQRWESSTESERLVVELGPGVHHVEIRKDGFRTYRTDLTVRRGEITSVNVALTQN